MAEAGLPHLLPLIRRRPDRPLPPGRARGALIYRGALFAFRRTLLVIDELGYLPLPGEAASACSKSQPALPETSIVVTFDRPVGTSGEILDDTTVTAAMLDLLLHRSMVLNLDGESYRPRVQ